ncbi:MqnA/MqnD/SBP family protein [Sulfurimonas sp.]
MLFGKIEYLNLLPFHVFMKRFTRNSSAKMTMEYRKNVPAKINKKFLSRSVDAAFISSISAKNKKHVNLGIIAQKSVKSVLVIPSKNEIKDKESASSNLLADVLEIYGKVLIGDKALRYALSHKNYTDLAQVWFERYKLPFVFALLCYHKDKKLYTKIEKEFLKRKVKIPQYLLKKASTKTKIAPKEILSYLELISYELDAKARLGLAKFYKEASKVNKKS